MSEALTIHSHFEDVAELAAGLAERVEEGRVILYGPTEYETGETIPFAVLLADGSPVIEGHGVVAACVDGGEDRDPSFRYDVVLTDLEMDPRSEIMFQRILMAGQSERPDGLVPEAESEGFGEPDEATSFVHEPTTVGDLNPRAAAMMVSADRQSAPDLEPVADEDDVPLTAAVEPEAFSVTKGRFVETARGLPAYDQDDDASGAANIVLIDGAIAPPVAPPPPAGFTVERLAAVGLSRPVHAATWWPEPTQRPAPDPSSGAFQYSGALPIPNQPPRPDLHPSERVAPAPHPVEEGSVVSPMPAPAPREARRTEDQFDSTAENDGPADEDDFSDLNDELDVDQE